MNEAIKWFDDLSPSLNRPKDKMIPWSEPATHPTAETFPREREIALNTIAYLRTLEDDFDGMGTLVPDEDTLNTAEAIIHNCFSRMYPTSIYPGIDRTLAFDYRRSDINGCLRILIDRSRVSVTQFTPEGRFTNKGQFVMPVIRSLRDVPLDRDLFALLPAYAKGNR